MVQNYPDMTDRQVMQRLLLGEWKLVLTLGASIGPDRLTRLTSRGWIELRVFDGKQQIRITPQGLEAFKTKLPEYYVTKRNKR